MDQTELQSKINNFLEDDEELFISDCKAPIKIDEYDSISGLNDLAGNLAEMQEADDVIAAIANEVIRSGYPTRELIRILKDHVYCIV